jgi:hypothetical protein
VAVHKKFPVNHEFWVADWKVEPAAITTDMIAARSDSLAPMLAPAGKAGIFWIVTLWPNATISS